MTKPAAPAPKPTSDKTDAPPAKPAATPTKPTEHGGPSGPEPTRYGDWERNGRCSDF